MVTGSTRLPRVLLVLGAGVGFLVVGGGLWLFLDLDGDGLPSHEELRVGTSPWWADTDADGLPDGWEVDRGFDPLVADMDGDGLSDGQEVRAGTAPLEPDSDGDGLLDGGDLVLDRMDPRTNAWLARGLLHEGTGDDRVRFLGEAALGSDPMTTDSDGDGLPDDREVVYGSDPLVADSNGDGVLDGQKGNPDCIFLVDCDDDGVPDALELELGWEPLNPDTFSVRLPDGVAYAFLEAGQEPGPDSDGDGIPDGWESSSGLLDWGSYGPEVGQRDLLVEFVRPVGPDSGQYAGLRLEPSYERVRSLFEQEGITMQYVETVVDLPSEPRPSLIPTRDSDYYRTVLDGTRYSGNPYVLTVVVNPQLDQTEIVHAGAAPIRGMLAAVDLSQYVQITLQSDHPNITATVGPFSPWVESLIRDGRLDTDTQSGGIRPDGRYYLMLSSNQGDVEMRWRPHWFQSPGLVHPENGEWVPLELSQTTLKRDEFAHVLLHEIGHTLGLCHTHDPECQKDLPSSEAVQHATSTMSYASASTTLAFLPSEWERVERFLTCPPPFPLALVAEGAPVDEVLDAKYSYSLDEILNVSVRDCRDFTVLKAAFEPQEARVYALPQGWSGPPEVENDRRGSVGYLVGVSAAAGGAAAAAVFLGRRNREPL